MEKIQTVAALLVAAQKAANEIGKSTTRMLDKVREAADIAVRDTVPGDIKVAHAAIIAAHGADLKACDKNVRAAFANAVLIALSPGTLIEVKAPKDGAAAEFERAEDMTSKADMVKAAAQLREVHGMRTSPKKAAKPTAPSSVLTLPVTSDGFAMAMVALPEWLKNPDHVAVLRQRLADAGFVLTNKAKQRVKAPAPTADAAPTPEELIARVQASIDRDRAAASTH